MARKISQDQLRRDIFKPLADHELLSQEQFEKAFPADKFERYSISGLNRARMAIFQACKANPKEQNSIITKAKSDFESLKRVNVAIPDPNKEGSFLEVPFFVRFKSTLEKGMKGDPINIADQALDQKDVKKKIVGIGTFEADRATNVEKDQANKKKPGIEDEEEEEENDDEKDKDNPILPLAKDKKSSDHDEENETPEQEDAESDKDQEEEETEQDDQEGENEDEDNGVISDEAAEVLAFIKEALEGGDDSVQEKEITEEEGFSDDETNAYIEELRDAGLIEVEEDEAGRGYNITALTNEGESYLAENGGEDEDNGNGSQEEGADVQGDKVVMDKQEFINEHEKLVDKLNQAGHKEEAGEQKKELEGVKQEDQQENNADAGSDASTDKDVDKQDEQQQQDNSGHQPTDEEKQGAAQGAAGDPAQLAAFAKQTPTDKLEEYVADQSNPPQNIAVAQAELDRRKQEGDAGPGGQGNGDTETPEMKAEKEEFDSWVDDYLESHDITDLQALVKELILANPAETKVLKDHYRSDYAANNKGNQALKIDKKEFEEWIDTYLEHQPQAHLKDYAKKLSSADPDTLNKLKGKYKALKDNKIV